MTNRIRFDRQKHLENVDDFVRTAEDSWEAYQSIFEREFKEINFPAMIIWEIMENFLYQFAQFHALKGALKRNDEETFNIATTKEMLNKLVSEIPNEFSKSPSTR